MPPSPEYLDRLVLNQASLPKARQWTQWLAYHRDALPADHGWEEWFRDTLLAWHHAIAVSARRLRGNPIWDFQGTMTDDTERLEPAAIRLCQQLEHYFPRNVDGRWKSTPDRYQRLMDCVHGALRQQVRLAREIDQMRERGRIDVDVLVDVKSEIATEQ
jgi:hypothetical protein